MSETSDTVGYPLPPSAIEPQLTLLEIWRPLRYIGSRGPRVFWRQCRVLGMSETGKPIWDSPTEWHVMDREFARKALAMPGGFFTFDWYPGNTFCVRRFNAPIEGDWAQARALRSRATTPGMNGDINGPGCDPDTL